MTRKTGAFKPLPDQKSTRFSWSPHEKQRYSSFFFEPPAGETDSVCIYELCQRSYVRMRHVPGSLSANDFCFLSLKRMTRAQYRPLNQDVSRAVHERSGRAP